MKKMLCAIVFGCLAVHAFAQGGEFSIRCTQAKASVDPNTLPFGARPFDVQEAGYEFSYLVRGTNIVEVKKDSLVIAKLTLKDGTDISKTAKGKPSYKYKTGSLVGIDDNGTYTAFTVQIVHDNAIVTELPIIEGSITVLVSDGEEVETVALERGDEKPRVVGDYTVKVTEEGSFLVVTVTGTKRGIVNVEVVSNGKTLSSRGGGAIGASSNSSSSFTIVNSSSANFSSNFASSDTESDDDEEKVDFNSLFSQFMTTSRGSPIETSTYFFAKPSADDITVNLTLRKGRKEQVLNF